MHVSATYNRAIEAAFRNYGLNSSTDMDYLFSQMTSSLTELEDLHTVLYLGVGRHGGVLPKSVWNDASYSALQYVGMNNTVSY